MKEKKREKRHDTIVEIVLRVLVEAEKVKPFQVAKRRILREYGLQGTGLDRYITALVYKVYRYQGLLDRIAERTTGERIERVPLELRQALRLAVYATLFSQPRDPELVRALRSRGSRLIASKYGWKTARVLVKLLDRLGEEKWEPSSIEERIEYRLLIPYTLYTSLRRLLGEEEVEALANALNTPPPSALRVNTLKTSVDYVIEFLRKRGVEAWPSSRVASVVFYRGGFTKPVQELVEKGLAVPQDEASAAAAPLLEPKPGERIVDLCAAPGGKTTHLAELSRNQAIIVAVELYWDRMERLKTLLDRTGTYQSVQPLLGDSLRAASFLRVEWADKVLVDPPCTSTGALAKHPDAKWRFNEKALAKLVEAQKRFIMEGYRLLRPGGRLLYTVCSLLPEEGEEVVKWLLERVKARLVPLREPYDESPLLPGTMRAWPHRHGVTGFFYALIEKTR